ncbi:MAG: peptidoglycan endopeptidase [Alphaproteobacteria bacterium]|nr:MAG: peptidoglycan endopeptidase [Alphaproteobacteria bacterium]
MTRSAEAIVAAGRALIGAPFRPQGRSAETGLDCLGLVAAAAGADLAKTRRDYRLRDFEPEAIGQALETLGFRRAEGPARPGDILILAPAPGRLHAAIVTPGGHLHADAGLRRVVEAPGAPPWPVLSAWRLS